MGEAVALRAYPRVELRKISGDWRVGLCYVRIKVGILSHKTSGHTKINLNFVQDAKLRIYTLAYEFTRN